MTGGTTGKSGNSLPRKRLLASDAGGSSRASTSCESEIGCVGPGERASGAPESHLDRMAGLDLQGVSNMANRARQLG